MATLAIKGHATRGSEVIGLLEMLGGIDGNNLICANLNCLYAISDNMEIVRTYIEHDTCIFTLEQFLEKYPYKVGDKVIYNDNPMTITKMVWEEQTNTIAYKLDDKLYCNVIEELQPYTEQKEESMEEGILYDEVDFTRSPSADKVKLILGKDYEIKEENGEWYVIKKRPQYPKTYGECCKMLFPNSVALGKILTSGYNCDLLKRFGELLTCRDAYWKIAGDWEPDWNDNNTVYYAIKTCKCDISLISTLYIEDCILAFPTEEMRDAFYENFKELIESLKELL